MTVLRQTSHIVQAVYAGPSDVSIAQVAIKVASVLTWPAPALVQTSESVQVVYAADGVKIAQTAVKVAVLISAGESASNTLVLTSGVTVVVVYNTVASDALTLTSVASADIIDRLGNTLALTSVASAQLILTRDVESLLTLTNVATVQQVWTRVAESVLTLTNSVSKDVPASGSNTLSFTTTGDYARPTLSALNLTQVASGAVSYESGVGMNVITFSQSVLPGAVLNLSANSTLVMSQTGASGGTVVNRSAASNLLFSQLVTPLGFLAGATYVLLEALPEASIVLPSAIHGDTENIVSDFDYKQSMNGTIRTYTRTSDSRVLKYTFRMSRSKSLGLEEFFRHYSATELKLTNWKGEQWLVYLITNPIDYVATTNYYVDVNLEFEGVRING